MEAKHCICGGKLVLEKQVSLSFLDDNRFLMAQGYYSVELYVCEECGRVEFYKAGVRTPEEREADVQSWQQVLCGFSDDVVKMHAEDTKATEEHRAAARRVLEQRSAQKAPASAEKQEIPEQHIPKKVEPKKGFLGFGKKKEDPWDE